MTVHFYARVSTKDQDPRSQIEAARARRIKRATSSQTASGARHDRPVLDELLASCSPVTC